MTDENKKEKMKIYPLDAVDYNKTAKKELSSTSKRLKYYLFDNKSNYKSVKGAWPFFRNLINMFKNLTQFIWGLAIFVKTILTDIRNTPEVFKGMANFIFAVVVDIVNIIPSAVTELKQLYFYMIDGIRIDLSEKTPEKEPGRSESESESGSYIDLEARSDTYENNEKFMKQLHEPPEYSEYSEDLKDLEDDIHRGSPTNSR